MNTEQNKDTLIVTRKSFEFCKQSWLAALELVRRDSYRIEDRKRHWNWEWLAIKKIQNNNS